MRALVIRGHAPDDRVELIEPQYAVENCKVRTPFVRDDTQVMVEGFDFARTQHVARGGVISSEWTAQMILAFKIMSSFYAIENSKDKSQYYSEQAQFYLEELQKLIISSLSPTGQGKGCLPYASQGNVDTGHGWRTPSLENTCSVAGTAYYIFAYYGYNPLNPSLSKHDLPQSNEERR